MAGATRVPKLPADDDAAAAAANTVALDDDPNSRKRWIITLKPNEGEDSCCGLPGCHSGVTSYPQLVPHQVRQIYSPNEWEHLTKSLNQIRYGGTHTAEQRAHSNGH